jgi:hypothetical protein
MVDTEPGYLGERAEPNLGPTMVFQKRSDPEDRLVLDR